MIAELLASPCMLWQSVLMAGKKDHRPYQTPALKKNRRLLVDAILDLEFYLDSKGYAFVHAPWFHKSDKKGKVQRSRLVAAIWNDHFLGKYDIVHHRDGNKSNDAPENLEIIDYGDHSALEMKKRWSIGNMNTVRKNGRWSLKYASCIECKSSKRRYQGHGMCSLCYQRDRRTSSSTHK